MNIAKKKDIGHFSQESALNDTVIKHVPLVKRIAYHLMSRLPPSVQADDLIQAGMIGLLEAARNYDPNQGASFETYAVIRVRGAMLDEIRKADWAPRSVHRKARKLAAVIREIENRTGRDARDHEVAEELEITLNEYHKMLQDVSGYRVLSYDDMTSEGDGISDHLPRSQENIQRADFKGSLAKAIAGLPERESMVITLYYDEKLGLHDIGSVLGIRESRVSKILSQALIRLQARMHSWRETSELDLPLESQKNYMFKDDWLNDQQRWVKITCKQLEQYLGDFNNESERGNKLFDENFQELITRREGIS